MSNPFRPGPPGAPRPTEAPSAAQLGPVSDPMAIDLSDLADLTELAAAPDPALDPALMDPALMDFDGDELDMGDIFGADDAFEASVVPAVPQAPKPAAAPAPAPAPKSRPTAKASPLRLVDETFLDGEEELSAEELTRYLPASPKANRIALMTDVKAFISTYANTDIRRNQLKNTMKLVRAGQVELKLWRAPSAQVPVPDLLDLREQYGAIVMVLPERF